MMNNLEVETYLLTSKNQQKIKESFIKIDLYDKINPSILDPDYLDGVIIIKFDNLEITDFSYWDDVVSLWYYMMEALEEVLNNRNKFSFSFPNQPIPVSLESKRDRIIFALDNKKMNFDLVYFYTVILEAGSIFFQSLEKLFPNLKNEYTFILNQIETIKNKINV